MQKWDLRFIELAKLVSTWSKDPSTKVGSVIVRPNKTVASVGFNGFPTSMPDIQELYENRIEKYSRIIHSEINSILSCKDKELDGYTLYTYPLPPCDRCCVQIIQSGIKRIVSPKLSDELLTRWNESINKTKLYCQECNVEFVEISI